MRAFIAIDIPETIRSRLREQQAAFRAACPRNASHADEIRWARPEGIHLTLKFLGHIENSQVEPVTDALAALPSFVSFPIEVKGLGFFPSARRPRVFWLGVEAAEALTELVSGVETAMERLGFAPERRGFTAHLTLARFKTPRSRPALEALVKSQGEVSLGRFDVSEFVLFESKLSPQGAEYRRVAIFPRPG